MSRLSVFPAFLLVSLLAFSPAAMAASLKVGFVTDWEYGSQSKVGHKTPSKGKKYLKTVVNYFNNTYKPDVVVAGGDYISSYSVTSKKAKNQLGSILSTFKKTKAPKLYCIGNHDLKKLTEEKVTSLIGINYTQTYVDMNGFRLVTLDTNRKNSKGKYETIGRISDDTLTWLDTALDTESPTIVFTHHPPFNTTRLNLYRANEVRAMLEKHSNVVAVVSGHEPINYSTQINDITYVIINNLSSKKAPRSFAVINAEQDAEKKVTVNISQLGKKPANYTITKNLSSIPE